jgi:WD40 repeat protein
MITSGDDGIVVWDTSSAKATMRLPFRDCNSVLVEPSGKGFLTFVESAILRWPIDSAPAGESTPARIGSSRSLAKLDGPTASGRVCWADPSGRYVGVCAKPFDRIVDLASPDRPPKTWNIPDFHGFVAVSPDGRFLAKGSYEGKGIRVWDTKSMAMVKEWLIGDAVVAFSPDGRRLVAGTSSAAPGGSKCLSWNVGTWEEGPRFPIDRTSSPGAVGFSTPPLSVSSRTFKPVIRFSSVGSPSVRTGAGWPRALARTPCSSGTCD